MILTTQLQQLKHALTVKLKSAIKTTAAGVTAAVAAAAATTTTAPTLTY